MLIIVNGFINKCPDEDKEITREDKRRIVAQFNEWAPRIPSIREVQTIVTFDQLRTFFETEYPRNITVKKGVIIRQEHSEGQILGQLFLDQHYKIICRKDGSLYGRQLVAKKIDQTLIKAFDDRDLIIVNFQTKKLKNSELNQDIFTQLGELLRDILTLPDVIPLITFKEAITYFVSNRPNDPKIKRGAILRQPHRQGHHIIQMFLDKNNELVCDSANQPYGRQLVAIKLDDELLETFGDKNVIMVE